MLCEAISPLTVYCLLFTVIQGAKTMNKRELLERIQDERARWETLLSEVGEARMTQAGVEGNWSIKDIIAHVTTYERWLVERLEAAGRGEQLKIAADQLDLDPRNALIQEEKKAEPLPKVLDQSQQVFQQLVTQVEKLSDEDLTEPGRLGPHLDPAWTEGQPLWQCIVADTYEHYRDHMPAIRTWLAEQRASEENPGEL